MARFVILFAELESLRNRVGEQEQGIEKMRRSQLDMIMKR